MEAPVCPNCESATMREVLSLTDLKSKVTTRTWECPRCCHRVTTHEPNDGGRDDGPVR